jgi:hypothetical protein
MQLYFARSSLLIIVLYVFSFSLSNKPLILFSKSSHNQAWGYVNSGWFIDSAGNIRNYHFSMSDSMDFKPITDGYFNKMMLLSTPAGKKVQSDTLNLMQDQIAQAGKGPLSYGGACADAGESAYNAFMYDSVNSRYSQVICYETGDMWACNASPGAKKIARWLISLDSLPFLDCTPPDSCLNLSSAIRNKPPIYTKDIQFTSYKKYFLNGKLSSNAKNKIVIGKGQKLPVELK